MARNSRLMTMITTKSPANPWDRSRFYQIEGSDLPSVTTVLEVIAKPALGPGYAREERRRFQAAVPGGVAKPGARDPGGVLAAEGAPAPGGEQAERDDEH